MTNPYNSNPDAWLDELFSQSPQVPPQQQPQQPGPSQAPYGGQYPAQAPPPPGYYGGGYPGPYSQPAPAPYPYAPQPPHGAPYPYQGAPTHQQAPSGLPADLVPVTIARKQRQAQPPAELSQGRPPRAIDAPRPSQGRQQNPPQAGSILDRFRGDDAEVVPPNQGPQEYDDYTPWYRRPSTRLIGGIVAIAILGGAVYEYSGSDKDSKSSSVAADSTAHPSASATPSPSTSVSGSPAPSAAPSASGGAQAAPATFMPAAIDCQPVATVKVAQMVNPTEWIVDLTDQPGTPNNPGTTPIRSQYQIQGGVLAATMSGTATLEACVNDAAAFKENANLSKGQNKVYDLAAAAITLNWDLSGMTWGVQQPTNPDGTPNLSGIIGGADGKGGLNALDHQWTGKTDGTDGDGLDMITQITQNADIHKFQTNTFIRQEDALINSDFQPAVQAMIRLAVSKQAELQLGPDDKSSGSSPTPSPSTSQSSSSSASPSGSSSSSPSPTSTSSSAAMSVRINFPDNLSPLTSGYEQSQVTPLIVSPADIASRGITVSDANKQQVDKSFVYTTDPNPVSIEKPVQVTGTN